MIPAKVILLIMMSRFGVSAEVAHTELPYDSMVKCQEAVKAIDRMDDNAKHDIEAICLER